MNWHILIPVVMLGFTIMLASWWWCMAIDRGKPRPQNQVKSCSNLCGDPECLVYGCTAEAAESMRRRERAE